MNYDLVFEGGGAKGMVFVGAMQEFEEQGHTYDRLLGTSAGAITAALLAAGYTTQEMLDALVEEEDGQPVFTTFMSIPPGFDEEAIRNSATLALLRDIDIPLIPDRIEGKIDYWVAKTLMQKARHLFSLIERGGWYSAHRFLEWLRRKLNEGTFAGRPRSFGQMTLSEFHTATGRELSLVASDTTGGRMLILNHRTAPDLPLAWAVRMSMSIPMVWPEVAWQAEWGQYHGKDLGDHYIVDGGLLSNFPIELFVSEATHITAVMGEKKGSDVLGLLIDESRPVDGAPARPDSSESGFDLGRLQVVRRIGRLVNTMTGAHDKMVIEALEDKVVYLPAQDYGTTEFDMSPARREALVAAGQQVMHAFFRRKEFESASVSFDTRPSATDVSGHANRVASRILEW